MGDLPLWPDPSVSSSAVAARLKCDRIYFYRVFWSWGGWERTASPSRRRAYALKTGTTGPQMAGSLVHEAMARFVRDARHARTSNAEAATVEAVGKLRAWARAAESTTAANASKKRPLSLEVYYGGDIDLDHAEETITECIANGAKSEHLLAIREATTDPVINVDVMESFQLDDWLTVWAAPDLAYEGISGRLIVVDWKTGRSRETDQEQVKLYALWAVEKGHADADRVLLSLSYLRSGVVTEGKITAGEVDEKRAELLTFAAEINDLRDAETGAPRMDAEAWPMVEKGSRLCAYCEFRELCKR